MKNETEIHHKSLMQDEQERMEFSPCFLFVLCSSLQNYPMFSVWDRKSVKVRFRCENITHRLSIGRLNHVAQFGLEFLMSRILVLEKVPVDCIRHYSLSEDTRSCCPGQTGHNSDRTIEAAASQWSHLQRKELIGWFNSLYEVRTFF